MSFDVLDHARRRAALAYGRTRRELIALAILWALPAAFFSDDETPNDGGGPRKHFDQLQILKLSVRAVCLAQGNIPPRLAISDWEGGITRYSTVLDNGELAAIEAAMAGYQAILDDSDGWENILEMPYRALHIKAQVPDELFGAEHLVAELVNANLRGDERRRRLEAPIFPKELARGFLSRETALTGSSDPHESSWSIWREWYQGFLAGTPLDWELQRRVALIPDADWEKGPAHIADIIEEIRKRFELEQRIAQLEAERERAVTAEARLGIGGNSPPEDMQIEQQVVRETTIIWAAIDELKKEIASDAPDKSRIARIIEVLGKGLLAILKWCGRKADFTVDQLIRWGVPIGAASLVANPEMVSAVIEAAKSWLAAL